MNKLCPPNSSDDLCLYPLFEVFWVCVRAASPGPLFPFLADFLAGKQVSSSWFAISIYVQIFWAGLWAAAPDPLHPLRGLSRDADLRLFRRHPVGHLHPAHHLPGWNTASRNFVDKFVQSMTTFRTCVDNLLFARGYCEWRGGGGWLKTLQKSTKLK